MVDEIELKFEIENYREMVEELLKISDFQSSAYELTVMYDQGKKLFDLDARLRLRKILDLKTNEETTEISYKKPKTREGIKVEEEYETMVERFDEMEKILKNIGFSSVSSYERIRDTFNFDNVKITLDSFPFGDYLEIEGEKEKIKKLAKDLDFDLSENITKSCDDIYADICNKEGRKVSNHIKFESKNNFEKEKSKRDNFINNYCKKYRK